MMKYKIGRNGGLLILFLMIAITNGVQCSKDIRNLHEFCLITKQNYDVGVDNNVELNLKSYPSDTTHTNKVIQKSKRGCRKKFNSLLPASHFFITISNMRIPKCKGECQCNYFEVSEMGNTTKYCGDNNGTLYFESKTDTIYINFIHSLHMTFEVSINFTVERNTYIRNGPPGEGQFIESPYFPTNYPLDYTAEYFFQNLDPNGYILLLFLDFQISLLSYIEVVGHNGSHVDKFDGSIFRPPAIVSQAKELQVKFVANDQFGSYPGFRAVCLFEKSFDFKVHHESPDICGELKTDLGGVMSVSTFKKDALFDCIWRLHKTFFSVNNSSILSVFVTDFKNIGRRASLEFREGLYSKSPVKTSLNCESSNCSLIAGLEIKVPASNGLYIRFNGYLNAQSLVKMSFSIFHLGGCAESEFTCDNGRCIQMNLHCDGHDHCTDGSDEKMCSMTEAKQPITSTRSSWWMPMPRQPYGIHKEKLSLSSASGFLIILIIGVIGIAIVLIVIAFMLFRQYRKRTRMEDHILPHIAMTEVIGIPPRHFTLNVTDWDVPPSYDDFLKSSDCYPPLLFTRMKSRAETQLNFPRTVSSKLKPNLLQSSCSRPKETSAKSISDFDVFLPQKESHEHYSGNRSTPPPPRPGCSKENDSLTWTVKGTIGFRSRMKRPMSLDSNLDKAHGTCCTDCCHLHLSITHAECSHALQGEQLCSKSLTSDFKLSAVENVDISLKELACSVGHPSSSNVADSDSNRRYTWSVVTDCSVSDSKVLTNFKTRCQSVPCESINLHCSLKRTPTI